MGLAATVVGILASRFAYVNIISVEPLSFHSGDKCCFALYQLSSDYFHSQAGSLYLDHHPVRGNLFATWFADCFLNHLQEYLPVSGNHAGRAGTQGICL